MTQSKCYLKTKLLASLLIVGALLGTATRAHADAIAFLAEVQDPYTGKRFAIDNTPWGPQLTGLVGVDLWYRKAISGRGDTLFFAFDISNLFPDGASLADGFYIDIGTEFSGNYPLGDMVSRYVSPDEARANGPLYWATAQLRPDTGAFHVRIWTKLRGEWYSKAYQLDVAPTP